MLNIYRELKQGEFILIGFDLAGDGEDYCSAQFLSKNYIDVPMVYNKDISASIAKNHIIAIMKDIFYKTGIKPTIAPERQNGGHFIIDDMLKSPDAQYFTMYKQRAGVGNIEQGEATKFGWDTTGSTRSPMLDLLQASISGKELTIYDKETVKQLFSFIKKKTSSGWRAEAESGAHDDLIMSLAIAWQLFQSEEKYDSVFSNYERPVYKPIDNIIGV